jgi:hypothetical protein
MAFKSGVILGPVSINATGSSDTYIGAFNSSGTINIGNASIGVVTIDCGTSGLLVGRTANVHLTTIGSSNTTSSTKLQCGTGQMNITATGGTMAVNSGTGAMSISDDASATTVEIGRGGAAKDITIGSTNTSSSLALQFGTGDFVLSSASGTLLTALDSGEVTMSRQSAFCAKKTAAQNNVTGAGTSVIVDYETEIFDLNSDYDGTNTFTAPVTGSYFFSAAIMSSGLEATSSNVLHHFSATPITRYFFQGSFAGIRSSGNSCRKSGTVVIALDAGDTVSVKTYINNMAGDTVDLPIASVYFSGFLIN